MFSGLKNKKWWAFLALSVSGSSQALIAPPLNWWPITFFYLAPGIIALTQLKPKQAFFGGWWLGISAQASIFYWVVHTASTFSNFPLPGAVGLLLLFAAGYGAYAAVFGWGFHWVREECGDWWPLGVAALFVACEFLNPQLFPYYQGVVWYQVPRFFLVTTLTGATFITFQIVLWNCVWVHLWECRKNNRALWNGQTRALVLSLAGLGVLSLSVSALRLHEIEEAEAGATTRRIALVQSNLEMTDVYTMLRQKRSSLVNKYVALSYEALEKDPDIDVFIWPEGALSGTPSSPYNRALLDFVEKHGVEVWTGGDDSRLNAQGKYGLYNAAFRVSGDGAVDTPYHKTILLPFGEFMPLADVFPILNKIEGVGRFTPGDGIHMYQAPAGRFCFLTCYEAIRNEYVRDGVLADADLLVNITYDAWFGDTSCPGQHLMLAALQSAQYGVPLVRAATTGISAFVDLRGLITQKSAIFTEDVLVGDVKRLRLPTLYAKWGDWFPWLCVCFCVAFVLMRCRRYIKDTAPR
jgi:apolipoprotein N-acyltransferase